MPRDPRYIEPQSAVTPRQLGLLAGWRRFTRWATQERPVQASGYLSLPNILPFLASVLIGIGSFYVANGFALAFPPLGFGLLLAGGLLSLWSASCRIQHGYGGSALAAPNATNAALPQHPEPVLGYGARLGKYLENDVWDYRGKAQDHTLLCNCVSAGLYMTAGLLFGGVAHPFFIMGGVVMAASLLVMAGRPSVNPRFQAASQSVGGLMFLASSSALIFEGLQTASAGGLHMLEGGARALAGICAAMVGGLLIMTRFDRQGKPAAPTAPQP